MDKKTALEILNLDAAATLAEAKKAYRTLAKQYHPDVVGKIFPSEKGAESRMKDINLAFRYLVPLLKLNQTLTQESNRIPAEDEPLKKKPQKAKKTGWDAVFIKCKEFLIQLFSQKSNPVVLKNQKRKQYPEQEPKQSKDLFRDILKKVHTPSFYTEKKEERIQKKRASSKMHSINDYQRYMELKQKMKSGRFRENSERSINRVTRIDPVDRVDAVKKG